MTKEEIAGLLTNRQKTKLILYLAQTMRQKPGPIKSIAFSQKYLLVTSDSKEHDELIKL